MFSAEIAETSKKLRCECVFDMTHASKLRAEPATKLYVAGNRIQQAGTPFVTGTTASQLHFVPSRLKIITRGNGLSVASR